MKNKRKRRKRLLLLRRRQEEEKIREMKNGKAPDLNRIACEVKRKRRYCFKMVLQMYVRARDWQGTVTLSVCKKEGEISKNYTIAV